MNTLLILLVMMSLLLIPNTYSTNQPEKPTQHSRAL